METVNPSVAEWTAKNPKGNGVGRSLFALDLMKSFAATRQWLRNIWEKFRSFCLMIWSRKEPILWFSCSLVWCKMPPAEAKEHRGGVVLNEKSTARFHKMEMGCGFFWGSLKKITTVFARNSTNCEKQNTKSTGHFPEGGRPADFLADFEAMGWLHTLLSSALFQHSVTCHALFTEKVHPARDALNLWRCGL